MNDIDQQLPLFRKYRNIVKYSDLRALASFQCLQRKEETARRQFYVLVVQQIYLYLLRFLTKFFSILKPCINSFLSQITSG